jgi:hypothetical protein
MNTVIFAFILLAVFVGSILLFIGSYYWTRARFNEALKKHLESIGYEVVKISSTDTKFKVETRSLNKGVSFGGPIFQNGGTGSGLHFRRVAVRNNKGGKELLNVAVEVQFFQSVQFHIEG